MAAKINTGLVLRGLGVGNARGMGLSSTKVQIEGRFTSSDPIKYNMSGGEVKNKPLNKLADYVSDYPKSLIKLPPGA